MNTLASRPVRPILACLLLGGLSVLALNPARAEDAHSHGTAAPAASAPVATPAPRTNLGGTRQEIQNTLRNALGSGDPTQKRVNLIVEGQGGTAEATAPAAGPSATPALTRTREPGLVIRPRPAAAAPATHHDIHWSYEGEGGPDRWAQLKPEFATCATGKRQSPIAIEDYETLKGPAEALQLRYALSKGTVTNNGHTIQVNVYGDNSLTVRGTTYQLLQFHFHAPSEERINGQSYPLVGHFVHRNDMGQLAVLAVLFEVGEGNPLIQNVWTYMPLDANDSVRMPPDLVDVNSVLPKDLRYYQFMGSLTTPPCTEGVLWMILKQPVPLSREQLRVFTQLYPNNARPVQPLNGRAVRNAVTLPLAPMQP